MLFKLLCAVVTRLLFILVSLMAVWRVAAVTGRPVYWCLTLLYLLMLAEMIFTLRRREGRDYKSFSPAIFLFLISIMPSLWILQLHGLASEGEPTECSKLDSTENIKDVFGKSSNYSTNHSQILELKAIVDNLSMVCANSWTLALHQMLLVLLILGKWLLPAGTGLTRDQLAQLLLIFVGTAADILEFVSETLLDVKDRDPSVSYIILGVWTWSMLQFPFHLSATVSSAEMSESSGSTLLSRFRKDIWSVLEALFIQDGPFLLVRLAVMVHYQVMSQMLFFFTIKNFLVVVLNIYRLHVLLWDHKGQRRQRIDAEEEGRFT